MRDQFDRTEARILQLLQMNGRMSNVQLSEAVGLSESPTFRRVKHLEEQGVIQRYAAVLNQRQVGLDVTAIVQVTMEKQPDGDLTEFHRCVLSEPHIIECFAMSGSHDFVMKVVARNMDHFSDLCMQRILKYPGVRHVESAFSLKEIKNTQVLPVNEE